MFSGVLIGGSPRLFDFGLYGSGQYQISVNTALASPVQFKASVVDANLSTCFSVPAVAPTTVGPNTDNPPLWFTGPTSTIFFN
jgi:hypothetical protein